MIVNCLHDKMLYHSPSSIEEMFTHHASCAPRPMQAKPHSNPVGSASRAMQWLGCDPLGVKCHDQGGTSHLAWRGCSSMIRRRVFHTHWLRADDITISVHDSPETQFRRRSWLWSRFLNRDRSDLFGLCSAGPERNPHSGSSSWNDT